MERGKRILSLLVVLCLVATVTVYIPDVLAFGEESSSIEKSSGTSPSQNPDGIQEAISWNSLISNDADSSTSAVQTNSPTPPPAKSGEITPPPVDAVGIYSAQDLSDMRNNPAGSYVLMNDIDLTAFTASGDGWIPVGTETEPFTGTLDGNGYSITGLRIYKSPQNTTSFVGGLFGYGTGMTVKNLTLQTDINVVAARAGRSLILGGLIGQADMATLSGCTVTAKIMAKAETTDVGGLIGRSISSVHDETGGTTIQDCITSGEINTSGRAYDLGGMVGEAARLVVANSMNQIKLYGLCTAPDRESAAAGIVARFTSGSIKDSTNEGIITTDVSSLYMTNTSSAYAGGIAALATATAYYDNFLQSVEISGCLNKGILKSNRMGTITQAGIVVRLGTGDIHDCENQGDIRNFTAYSGGAFGIVADSGSSDIVDCINKGDILCSSIRAAGITDSNYYTILRCSNWGTITSMDMAGGICIINTQGTISECLNAGEISGSLGSFQTTAGGIASANRSIINNCYNIGAIRGAVAGGIVGSNQQEGVISTCMSMGSVYSGTKWGGSIAGSNFNMIQNTYYKSGTKAGCGENLEDGQDGSKGLSLTQLKAVGSYVGFDFVADGTPAVWAMSSNTGWPKLNGVQEVYVSSLAVAKTPKKTSYLINAKVDTKGLILKATLSNGRTQYLDVGYILGTYADTKGIWAIPVSYAGKTASFDASFQYFTVAINESSLLVLDSVDFPGVYKMQYYTASSASGPYSIWLTSTPLDGTDTDVITNDLTWNKTYYFKVQPIYPSGAGPVYGYYNSIRFKPTMPIIDSFYRTENGVQMDCMPVRYVDGFEIYAATSIGGPYTKIGESTTFSLSAGNLTKGTFYFFVARTYINHNGNRVYSDYSPVQWGRFL